MKCYKCGVEVEPGLHRCPFGNPVFYGPPGSYAPIDPTQKKKPYKKPELRVYGDIRGMTESHIRGSMHDSSHGMRAHKTA